ncbi:hypothetical protein Hamer_G032081, partial [Homarus americanus]
MMKCVVEAITRQHNNMSVNGGGGGGSSGGGKHTSPRVCRISEVSYAPSRTPHHVQDVSPVIYETCERQKEEQEHPDTLPRVRYTRPDVTHTRTSTQCPYVDEQDWGETEVPYDYCSVTPDLACPVTEDVTRGTRDVTRGTRDVNRATRDVSRATRDSGCQQWTGTLDVPEEYREISPPSYHGSLCMVPQGSSVEARLSDALGLAAEDPWAGGRRLSRSLEDLPTDIQDHILRCQCTCDHLGYGNFS